MAILRISGSMMRASHSVRLIVLRARASCFSQIVSWIRDPEMKHLKLNERVKLQTEPFTDPLSSITLSLSIHSLSMKLIKLQAASKFAQIRRGLLVAPVRPPIGLVSPTPAAPASRNSGSILPWHKVQWRSLRVRRADSSALCLHVLHV